MLHWLCKGQDVSASMQDSSLALLGQMKGLHCLSDHLCPSISSGEESTQLNALGILLAGMPA